MDADCVPMAVYDVIRTGPPDYSAFWQVRTSQARFKNSSTLMVRLKQHVEPIAYQPIPQVLLPADHPVILDEWTDEVTLDGTEIQRMSVRPGILSIELRPCSIPMVFCEEMWKVFIGVIDNILDAKLRQGTWDHQTDISKLNLQLDGLRSELSTSKAAELQATQKAVTTLVESNSRLDALKTQNDLALKMAEDKFAAYVKATPKKVNPNADSLAKIRSERDSLLVERDQGRLKLTETESKLQTTLARLKQKDKTIKSILNERRQADQGKLPSGNTRGQNQRELDSYQGSARPEAQPGPSALDPSLTTDFIAREVTIRLRQRELDERERALNSRETSHRELDNWTSSGSRHSPY
jgi:hypothetical protein